MARLRSSASASFALPCLERCERPRQASASAAADQPGRLTVGPEENCGRSRLRRSAWARRSLLSSRVELLGAIALEIEKARQIGMIEAEAGGGRHHRLAVIGHAQPGGLDHGNVIGPVADRRGARRARWRGRSRDARGWRAWRWRSRIGSTTSPASLPSAMTRRLAWSSSKPQASAAIAAKQSKPPETSAVRAPWAFIVWTKARAPGVSSTRSLTCSSKAAGWPLEHGDPRAQRSREIHLAPHRGRGHGGDGLAHAGQRGQLVGELPGDDGQFHIGQEQALAPSFGGLDRQIHRQPRQMPPQRRFERHAGRRRKRECRRPGPAPARRAAPAAAPASRKVARAAARMGSSSAAPMPAMRVRTCATPVLLYRGRQTIKNARESESAYRARFFSRAPGFWAGGGAREGVDARHKSLPPAKAGAEHDRGGNGGLISDRPSPQIFPGRRQGWRVRRAQVVRKPSPCSE